MFKIKDLSIQELKRDDEEVRSFEEQSLNEALINDEGYSQNTVSIADNDVIKSIMTKGLELGEKFKRSEFKRALNHSF